MALGRLYGDTLYLGTWTRRESYAMLFVSKLELVTLHSGMLVVRAALGRTCLACFLYELPSMAGPNEVWT